MIILSSLFTFIASTFVMVIVYPTVFFMAAQVNYISALVWEHNTTITAAVLGDTDSIDAKDKEVLKLSLEKIDFRADENIIGTITHKPQTSLYAKIIDTEENELPVLLQQTENDNQTTVTVFARNKLHPGKYTLSVTDETGKTIQQDFNWGMLSLNKEKIVYNPGETATLYLETVDDKGVLFCATEVAMNITSPEGKKEELSVKNKKITSSRDCTNKEESLMPSYTTLYPVHEPGTYTVLVRAEVDKEYHEIVDTFQVLEETTFDIKRSGNTHLYDQQKGLMEIEITAHQDFSGTVAEVVPEQFVVTQGAKGLHYEEVTSIGRDESSEEQSPLHKKIMDPALLKLQLPFTGTYPISQGFGSELTDVPLIEFYAHFGMLGHDGLDFALPEGTSIYAVDDGIVLFSGPGDYGNTVIVQHSWGRSYYGHLQSVTATIGNHIIQGTQIGVSGSTGQSTGPHLHFSMKPNRPDINNGYGGKVDPQPFFPALEKSGLTVLGEMTVNEELPMSQTATESAQDETIIAELTPTPTVSLRPQNGIKTPVASEGALREAKQLQETIKKQMMLSELQVDDQVKIIKWNLSMKRGQKRVLQYNYQLPAKTAHSFLVGSVSLFDKNTKQVVYDEGRKWQTVLQPLSDPWYDDAWQSRMKLPLKKATLGLASHDRTSKAQQGQKVNSLSWKHTTAAYDNRLLLIGVVTDGTEVRTVTYGDQQLKKITGKSCPEKNCLTELWYLKNPKEGNHTTTVLLSKEGTLITGSSSLYDVDLENTFTETTSASDSGISYMVLGAPANKITETTSSSIVWHAANTIEGIAAITEKNDLTKTSESTASGLSVGINPSLKDTSSLFIRLPFEANELLITDKQQMRLKSLIEKMPTIDDATYAWVSVPSKSIAPSDALTVYFQKRDEVTHSEE